MVYGPSHVRAARDAWVVVAVVAAINTAAWVVAYQHQHGNPACGAIAGIAVAWLVRSLLTLRGLHRLRAEFWVLA
jgi:hypothetical protein